MQLEFDWRFVEPDLWGQMCQLMLLPDLINGNVDFFTSKYKMTF